MDTCVLREVPCGVISTTKEGKFVAGVNFQGVHGNTVKIVLSTIDVEAERLAASDRVQLQWRSRKRKPGDSGGTRFVECEVGEIIPLKSAALGVLHILSLIHI